jgi:hypothetical protein
MQSLRSSTVPFARVNSWQLSLAAWPDAQCFRAKDGIMRKNRPMLVLGRGRKSHQGTLQSLRSAPGCVHFGANRR